MANLQISDLPLQAVLAGTDKLGTDDASRDTWRITLTQVTAFVNTVLDNTGTTTALTANTQYYADNTGLVTFTLPASVSFGDRYIIYGVGSGGWKVAQNAGQQIHLGSASTTSGTGGSLASSNRYDAVQIIAYSSTVFTAYTLVGNISVT